MTVAEKLREDRDAIYLGNLFTIEADIPLPTRGKNGSSICWESEYPHLIDNEGKVHRPRAGTGNRALELTATLCLAGESVQRSFAATVLQVESTLLFVRVLPITLYLQQGKKLRLPAVAILETEDGCFVTLPVQWETEPNYPALAPGHYEVRALPPDARYPELCPVATITVGEEAPPTPARYEEQVQPFPLGEVHIDGGVFAENKHRMQEYLKSVDLNQMLYNFRQAAGLSLQGAAPMTGWDAPECQLKGHTTGHFLSALAFASCCGEEEALWKEKVATMVDALAECQNAMAASGKYHPGFLSGYSEQQFDQLEEYALYPKIWAPWYTLHKIMAGFLDCYEFAGNQKALEVCEKLGLWASARLAACGEEKRQKMWSMYIAGEFGGMNEVMARLYGLRPKPEYLKAAYYFDNPKLYYPMAQNVDTLGGIHANQHIPQIIGVLEMYRQGAANPYYEMAQNFWHMVNGHHCYSNGGTGEGEMFQKANGIGAFLSDRTAESCASYNMLKLTGRLFGYQPKASFMDYYECALLNHILSSHDTSGPTGGSTYFMPLEPGGEKHFHLSENSCCHGTGLENHLKYQECAYFYCKDTLYLTLYLPSTLHWRKKGLVLCQTGDFLTQQKMVLQVKAGKAHARLMLRLPAWLESPATLLVNGAKTAYETQDGFAVLECDFEVGDTVELQLPFTLRLQRTPDKPELISVYYGPLMLAAQNESQDFLPWPKGKTATQALTSSEKPLCFTLGEVLFCPQFSIQNSRYHVYLKEK